MLLAGSGLVVAAAAAFALGGCTTTVDPELPTVSFKWSVSPKDPCGKLAGSLAIADLFDSQSPPEGPDFQEWAASELAERCPPDTQPEAFDFTVSISVAACNELAGWLEMVRFFDVTAFADPERRDMIDALIADLEGEVETRCR